jgi:hypothetical protein
MTELLVELIRLFGGSAEMAEVWIRFWSDMLNLLIFGVPRRAHS